MSNIVSEIDDVTKRLMNIIMKIMIIVMIIMNLMILMKSFQFSTGQSVEKANRRTK